MNSNLDSSVNQQEACGTLPPAHEPSSLAYLTARAASDSSVSHRESDLFWLALCECAAADRLSSSTAKDMASLNGRWEKGEVLGAQREPEYMWKGTVDKGGKMTMAMIPHVAVCMEKRQLSE